MSVAYFIGGGSVERTKREVSSIAPTMYFAKAPHPDRRRSPASDRTTFVRERYDLIAVDALGLCAPGVVAVYAYRGQEL